MHLTNYSHPKLGLPKKFEFSPCGAPAPPGYAYATTWDFSAAMELFWQILGMRQSSNLNSTTYELRTFSTDSKFDECFVVKCEFVD